MLRSLRKASLVLTLVFLSLSTIFNPLTTNASNNTFSSSTMYFEVITDDAVVYDNSSQQLVNVGNLKKGEVYPRVRDYGNWHQIKFGSGYGYVWKGHTIPSDGTKIKNINNKPIVHEEFTPLVDLAVLDNSSGQLVPFGIINKGVSYPIVADYGKNWYAVDFSGRIGYVYKPATMKSFKETDNFFKVIEDNLPVYDDSSGELIQVGALKKDQEFHRLEDLGEWHKIKFGSSYGLVQKSATAPSDGSTVKNNNNKPISLEEFTPLVDLAVLDNSSGQLVPFGTIKEGVSYPIVSDYGKNWYAVDLGGRIGYVYKPATMKSFKETDEYFKVLEDNLPVFDDSTGELIQIGALEKNQEFHRLDDSGEWHKIKFGSSYGLVQKNGTAPSDGLTIKNTNNKPISNEKFIPLVDLAVLDNTSGQLVPFGTIKEGVNYPIVSDYGKNWYAVDLGGRIGYVYKPATMKSFKETDKFFKVTNDNVYIFENSTGEYLPVASLVNGQVYPRLSDDGKWHKIKFGNGFGYVKKDGTIPNDGTSLENINDGLNNSNQLFLSTTKVPVYSSKDSNQVAFSYLEENVRYPIISKEDNWLKIDIAGLIGYIDESFVELESKNQITYKYTQYDYTLMEMLSIQIDLPNPPQTDKYYNTNAYVSKRYVDNASNSYPTEGYVSSDGDGLRVREEPNTNSHIFGYLNSGDKVTIVAETENFYEIKYGYWRNAKEDDVLFYLDPSNNERSDQSYFQFLLLSETAGISADQINKRILLNKGILHEQGQTFVNASQQFNINEIYLISHALLETGNGTSELATGVLVEEVDGEPVPPKVVYNMFGWHAFDGCAIKCGSEFAYDAEWFSPEAAILGGAQLISENYVNNSEYKQDTLYKIRWNPLSPGKHQYASDIGWAVKQVYNIIKLYNLVDNYTLTFDIPVYQTEEK
jgi:mannosyl-glycoprotein endo-beta-N-acetylglucosaminidase